MFSFISISREDDKVAALRSNLELIFGKGGPWELLIADGHTEDIFTGYNRMVEEARGEHLVFLHDDVTFLCNRASFEKPVELMAKPFTGFIGAAGATMMPAEGCWWKVPNNECRGAVYHPSKGQNPFGIHLNCWPHVAAEFGRTVICDGVLLMCHKRTFDKVGGFDAETFKGFHFYDVDVTLRAHLMGLHNYVAPIPLVHRSHGVTNDEWEDNRKLFVQKHKKVLPVRL